MATQFTPGPWSPVRYEIGQKALTVEASGLPLLKMYSGRNEEANARLIAAAPDLYGSALVALDYLDTPASAHSEAQKELIIQSLRDALAKAGWEA